MTAWVGSIRGVPNSFLRIGDDPGPRVSNAFAASWNSDVPTCPVLLLRHLRLGVLDSLAISCFVNQPHCKGLKKRHYYVTSARSIWVEEYEIPMNVMEISDINLGGLQHVVYASYRNRDLGIEIQRISFFRCAGRRALIPEKSHSTHHSLSEDDLWLLHLNSMRFSLHLPLQNHILILLPWQYSGHAVQILYSNYHDLPTNGMTSSWM